MCVLSYTRGYTSQCFDSFVYSSLSQLTNRHRPQNIDQQSAPAYANSSPSATSFRACFFDSTETSWSVRNPTNSSAALQEEPNISWHGRIDGGKISILSQDLLPLGLGEQTRVPLSLLHRGGSVKCDTACGDLPRQWCMKAGSAGRQLLIMPQVISTVLAKVLA